MANSDWYLAARWQTMLGANYYIVARTVLPKRGWIYRVLDGELPELFLSFSATGQSFPYGFPVDPD